MILPMHGRARTYLPSAGGLPSLPASYAPQVEGPNLPHRRWAKTALCSTEQKCIDLSEWRYICAGKRTAKLSLLFLRENRVPVIPISLRNRFLALAPAVRYGVSNLAALRLGCVYCCTLVLRRHVIFVSGVSFDFLVVAGHRLS